MLGLQLRPRLHTQAFCLRTWSMGKAQHVCRLVHLIRCLKRRVHLAFKASQKFGARCRLRCKIRLSSWVAPQQFECCHLLNCGLTEPGHTTCGSSRLRRGLMVSAGNSLQHAEPTSAPMHAHPGAQPDWTSPAQEHELQGLPRAWDALQQANTPQEAAPMCAPLGNGSAGSQLATADPDPRAPLMPVLGASRSAGVRQAEALSEGDVPDHAPGKLKLTPVETALLPALIKLSGSAIYTLLGHLRKALGLILLCWGCLKDLKRDFFGDRDAVCPASTSLSMHALATDAPTLALSPAACSSGSRCTMQDWERVDVSTKAEHPVYLIVRRRRLHVLQELILQVSVLASRPSTFDLNSPALMYEPARSVTICLRAGE